MLDTCAFRRNCWRSGKIRENSGNSKGSEFGISEKCCILEKSRKNLVKFGENSAKFWQNLRIFGKKTAKISAIFNENFEIRERCKGVHCVDLGESFPTSIYLQNLASIQPRTSLVKFARSPRTDPPGSRCARTASTHRFPVRAACAASSDLS